MLRSVERRERWRPRAISQFNFPRFERANIFLVDEQTTPLCVPWKKSTFMYFMILFWEVVELSISLSRRRFARLNRTSSNSQVGYEDLMPSHANKTAADPLFPLTLYAYLPVGFLNASPSDRTNSLWTVPIFWRLHQFILPLFSNTRACSLVVMTLPLQPCARLGEVAGSNPASSIPVSLFFDCLAYSCCLA